MAAGYGIVIANSKWQFCPDISFVENELQHMSSISPLFIKTDHHGHVVVLVIKFVDDILVTGSNHKLRSLFILLGEKFNFGTVTRDHGKIRFYGFWKEKFEDFSCSIDAERKL